MKTISCTTLSPGLLLVAFLLKATEASLSLCSLCGNDDNVPRALEKSLFIPEFPEIDSCEGLFENIWLLATNEQECTLLRSKYSSTCGCPPPADPSPPPRRPCTLLCDKNESKIPGAMFDVNDKEDKHANKMTCNEIESLLKTIDESDDLCDEIRTSVGSSCGDCLKDDREIGRMLQFYSEPQERALMWLPRITAMLSLIGSSFLSYHIMSKRKYLKQMYHQIILAMSIFDVITDIGLLLLRTPMPRDGMFGMKIDGANGNDFTCALQGFSVQLGMTSMFCNISLSFYYLLVINYGWKENQLQKAKYWLYFPMLIGVALAFAGIPFYGPLTFMCHVPVPPLSESQIPALVFSFTPVALTIFYATTSMVLVYVKVRSGRKPSDTSLDASGSSGWRSNVTTGNNSHQIRLEVEVAKQAFAYLLGFYICWPFVIVSLLSQNRQSYPIILTTYTLLPLQGFFNVLVYTRPRYERSRRSKNRNSRTNRMSNNHHLSTVANSRLTRVAKATTDTTESQNTTGNARIEEEQGCEEMNDGATTQGVGVGGDV